MTKKRWIIVIVIVLILSLGWFCYSKVKSKISNIENKIAQEIDKGTFDDLLSELEADEELQNYLDQNEDIPEEKENEKKEEENIINDKSNLQKDKQQKLEEQQEVKQHSNNNSPSTKQHNENNTQKSKDIKQQQVKETEENTKIEEDSKDQLNVENDQVKKDTDEIEVTEEKQELQNDENNNNISDNKQISGDTIKNLEKHVDIGDKKIGFKLASKVDVPYLMRLAKGGITADDKAKAKQHLKERLTADEYNQAKALIYKYLKLIGK